MSENTQMAEAINSLQGKLNAKNSEIVDLRAKLHGARQYIAEQQERMDQDEHARVNLKREKRELATQLSIALGEIEQLTPQPIDDELPKFITHDEGASENA